MDTTLMSTPLAGLASFVARERSATAPNLGLQGTGLSCAVPASAHTAQVAFLGARVIDLPGLVPRGAPV